MGIIEIIYICLLLLIPILLMAATLREFLKNSQLANIWVLVIYGIVLIWWGFSFFLAYPNPNQSTICGAGLIVCVVARVLHQRINRTGGNSAIIAGDLEISRSDENRGQIKHLISLGCAILFLLGLLCAALVVISKFLPT
jgi:L-lactate permease